MIMDLYFLVLCTLESVSRWGLSTMKVLLELELEQVLLSEKVVKKLYISTA